MANSQLQKLPSNIEYQPQATSLDTNSPGTPTLTAPRKKQRLFPLHLTSFENYMIVDDRPKYPMTFIVQLELSGKIDRTAFNEAIDQALLRHPLLTAVIGPGKQGKDCWVKAPNPNPHVDWAGIDDPIRFPNGEHINIRNEVGLRIFVRSDENQAIVTSQFHHSACDGIGSYQFLGDVLYFYAERTTDTPLDPLPEINVRRLRDRGRASYDLNDFRLPNGKYQTTWDLTLKYLMRNNVVLRGTKPIAMQDRVFPGIVSTKFDKKNYKSLRLAAQNRGQIINDMLLEKLFETLFNWKKTKAAFSLRKHVCVMMPLNLREPEHNDIPACNIVAQSFVRRSKASMQDPEKFRTELGNELLKIKHERKKIRFMHMIAGAQAFYPKTMQTLLDMKSCIATAILSNTGDPTKQFYFQLPRSGGIVQVGNLRLEDISGVPPMRPGTSATVSIFTYRRELKICLRCDPNHFDENDSRQLLEQYVDNLNRELI